MFFIQEEVRSMRIYLKQRENLFSLVKIKRIQNGMEGISQILQKHL